MKDIIKEFFDTDFVSKIRTTKKVDKYINIEDMTGDEVAREYNKANKKGQNPSFGIYSSGGNSMDGYIVQASIIIEVEVNKSDMEFKRDYEKYIETNAFSFIAKRLREIGYKRLCPTLSESKEYNKQPSFLQLYKERDFEGVIKKMGFYYK